MKKKNSMKKPSFFQKLKKSKKLQAVAVMAVFGVVGLGVFLYNSFAATGFVSYHGYVGPNKPTVNYSVTSGEGTMRLTFRSSESKVSVSVLNSDGTSRATLLSESRTKVTKEVAVTPGTYKIVVTKAPTQKNGANYRLNIYYPPADVTAPSVAISAPSSNAPVKGQVGVTVNATDNTAVSKVELYADSTLVGTDGASPYSVTWDSTKVTNGSHKLQVKGYDASGNVGIATATVEVANPTTPPKPGDTCVSTKNGLPAAGQAYAGATVSGTVSITQRESYFGQTLPIHRTYWGASNSNSGVSTAQSDVAAKRLPWVSFKLPGTWSEMAAGKYDAWANDLITKLDNINGPVWLAFHHEPENDGQPIASWVAMQRHLATLVKARNSDNIAYSIIVMGWYQTFGSNAAIKLPALWPGDGLVQIVGMDPYNWYGTLRSDGTPQTYMDYLQPYWDTFNAFASAHGARWAVAETGYTNEAAAKDPNWANKVFTSMKNSGGIGMSYFDTSYNSGGYSWTLDTPGKMADFKNAINASARICGSN